MLGANWPSTSAPYSSTWRPISKRETEKPASLLEPLIAYGCPPGGVVLDLFAGSCSTGVAAKRTGRRAVLYELREEQAELAAEIKVEKARADLKSAEAELATLRAQVETTSALVRKLAYWLDADAEVLADMDDRDMSDHQHIVDKVAKIAAALTEGAAP